MFRCSECNEESATPVLCPVRFRPAEVVRNRLGFVIKDRIPCCEIHRYAHAKPSEYLFRSSSECCERFAKESSLPLFKNSLALLLQKRYKDGKLPC